MRITRSIKIYPHTLLATLSIIGVFCACLYFQFDGLYGQDGYAYLQQVDNLFSGNEFYPPFYALLGAGVNGLVNNKPIALQIISILSWLGASLLLFRLLTKHGKYAPEKVGILLFIFFLLSPFVTRMGILVMSDSLSMFMGLWAFYLALFSKSKWVFLLFFAVAALAVLTRYALGILLLPALLYVVYRLTKEQSPGAWLRAALGAGVGLALLVISFVYFTQEEGSTQHSWLQLWSIENFFSNEFDHKDGHVHYALFNILYVFKNIVHPIYFLLFFPLLFFIKKSDFSSPGVKIAGCSILVYALFLAGIPFQNDRFLLPSFPLLIVVFYPAMERLHTCLKRYGWILYMLIPVQLYITNRLLDPVFSRYALEQHLVHEMRVYEREVLYSFDVDVALRGRGLQFEYANMWQQEFQEFAEGALVLFNEKKFETQWEGKNPMLNWEKLRANYVLTLVSDMREGWKLYRISHNTPR